MHKYFTNIHLVNWYLSLYKVPDIILGSRKGEMNKTDTISALRESTLVGDRQIIKKTYK